MLPATSIHYTDLGSQELAPGTYTTTGALGLTGKLKLVSFDSGPSVAGDKWKFLIGGAFTTTTSSKMVSIGDGSSANMHWVPTVATGAILLGANSVAVGSMETLGYSLWDPTPPPLPLTTLALRAPGPSPSAVPSC
jgi:hypothetical protein